ncbi:MAG TPA: hypothetical protein VGM88_24810 [Kofleriaceae bacterium]|jgi:hypothetical protein
MRALVVVAVLGGTAWAGKPTLTQAKAVATSFGTGATGDFFASPDPSDGLARFTSPFDAAGWGTDWACERATSKTKAERAGMGACIAGHMPSFEKFWGWSAEARKVLPPHLLALAADFEAMRAHATVVFAVEGGNAAVFAVELVHGKPKIRAVFVEQVEK